MATEPITFKLDWKIWSLIAAVIIIISLTIRHCNSPAPSVDTGRADSSFINIDSINAKHRADMQRVRDSLYSKDQALVGVQDDIDMYVDRVRTDAGSIRLLNSIISKLQSTTPKEVACDSLVAVSNRYLNTNDSLLNEIAIKDTIQLAQLQLAIDAVNDCDRAYEAVTSNLLSVRETYDALKRAAAPRVVVYAGFTGTYNALVYGVGPSIAVQGKRGGIVQGSYQITNGRPLYQAGYLVPIRLRKRL